MSTTNQTLAIPEGQCLKISMPPQPVGYWVLYPDAAYQTRFAMYAKPTDDQIANTEALLGWKWEDA